MAKSADPGVNRKLNACVLCKVSTTMVSVSCLSRTLVVVVAW